MKTKKVTKTPSNSMGKAIRLSDIESGKVLPYEVWVCNTPGGTFTTIVLKAYQSADKEVDNPYARRLVATQSPYTFGDWETGDTYWVTGRGPKDLPRSKCVFRRAGVDSEFFPDTKYDTLSIRRAGLDALADRIENDVAQPITLTLKY